MAHFAQIDADNTVVQVLVVPDDQEHRGQDFLANDLKLGGNWIQTSYNHRIRKQFAGIGFRYEPMADVFVAPQPFPWFVLNERFDWVCPDNLDPLTGDKLTAEQVVARNEWRELAATLALAQLPEESF